MFGRCCPESLGGSIHLQRTRTTGAKSRHYGCREVAVGLAAGVRWVLDPVAFVALGDSSNCGRHRVPRHDAAVTRSATANSTRESVAIGKFGCPRGHKLHRIWVCASRTRRGSGDSLRGE